jgi:hypothetical protein
MKIALSIPNELFESAEALGKRLGVSHLVKVPVLLLRAQ